MDINNNTCFYYIDEIKQQYISKPISWFRESIETTRATYNVYIKPQPLTILHSCAYCDQILHVHHDKPCYKFYYMNTPLKEYFLCTMCANGESVSTASKLVLKQSLYF